MPIKQLTSAPTEADLEAEIHRALRAQFPWIPAKDLRHQTKFSLRMGRSTVEIDGTTVSRAEARSDVIVYASGKPICVLELKREGKPITQDDVDQGLSYARMLHPQAPLVVATNGTDTRIVEAHSAEEWTPSERSAATLQQLIQVAAQAASADTKEAVRTLLGTGSQTWVSAVRAATDTILDDLTGPWNEPLLPFVRGFLIPREATQAVLSALRDLRRLVIVAGAPLVGKSNVLRELALQTREGDEFAVLFVDADGGGGHGVFQQLADLLAEKLAWPVTQDEARSWLQRLSNSGGPALVLAIDGLRPNGDEMRKDVEEIISGAFGANVRIVFTLDDTAVRSFTRNVSGRGWSKIGRTAVGVEFGPLSDAEFNETQRLLWDHRIGFVKGVHAAAEMRTPWVLRAMVAEIEIEPERANEDLTAALPPMLGLNLFDYVRRRFPDTELRRPFQAIARAVLADSTDRMRPIDLILESIGVYIVRDETLRATLDRAEIDSLILHGLLKPGVHPSGDAVLVVRLPELLASEMAGILAREVAERSRNDVEAAARWLTGVSQSLPLGDIVAAQAVYDAARRGEVALNFVTTLLRTEPREESISPGTKFAMQIPGGGMLLLTLREDGSLAVVGGCENEVIPPDDDEESQTFLADVHSWLILSHLAARPSVIPSVDGRDIGRIDPGLLLVLGTCPFVLRGPQNDPARSSTLTHKIPGLGNIVCHKMGIVEPVTLAIYFFLGSSGTQATDWIEEAISRESFPLLARIEIALQQVVSSADTTKAAWAKCTIEQVVRPAMENFPPLH